MRNKSIGLLFCLLAVSVLLPYPVPPAWIEVADAGRLLRDSRDGLVESLESSAQGGLCFIAEVLGERDHVHLQPDAIASTTVPNDEYFDRQWALTRLQPLDAWANSTSGQDILIAVLDTGIDCRHEDLVGKVAASVNVTDSPTASDLHGHGTHIAGIIAAATNNGIGIASVAPDCRLMNVKVADDSGTCYGSVVARGITWAVEHGANVINMSLVIDSPSPELQQAIDYAWSNGVVVVAAAGNDMGTRLAYPAYYSNCIAVAAADVDGHVASWSGDGAWVDVAAPGVKVYSILPDNGYGYKSGTSMAAAHVSGVAGLLLTTANDDNGNGFVNDEVRMTIEESCDELGILSVTKDALRQGGLR